MKTLKLKKDSVKLIKNVLSDLKASPDLGLYKCVQCGMCTSMCPAASQTDYDPRDMIRKVLEDDETVVDDENIWYCFSCYTCHSICQSGNSACEINQILRQMSIKKGEGAKQVVSFAAYGDSFIEQGVGSIPNNYFDTMVNDIGPEYMHLKMYIDDIRSELGLGAYILPKDSIKEVESILEGTGFKERLSKIKRCKK